MNEFKNSLKFFLADFVPYSNDYLSRRVKKSSQYPELIGDFYKNLRDFSYGGKALRPFLVYLAYKVSGGKDLKKILPVCLAVELIHNCFLIQDDVIDKSDVRRGKATIHKRYEKSFGYHYGISQAIMASDVACFEAFDLFNKADFGEELKKLAYERFIKTLLETVYGEALDVEYSYKETSLQYIRQMTDLKTARYSFVGPLIVGAALGGEAKLETDAMEKYGLLVGTAFQLHDDILGVFGDEKILGKSVLSDLRDGKNTILIYKTRELANKKDLDVIKKVWGDGDSSERDLSKVRGIITRSGALDWCQREQVKLIFAAKKQLAQITQDKNIQKILFQLADFVVAREK